jgi:hypothetical protein
MPENKTILIKLDYTLRDGAETVTPMDILFQQKNTFDIDRLSGELRVLDEEGEMSIQKTFDDVVECQFAMDSLLEFESHSTQVIRIDATRWMIYCERLASLFRGESKFNAPS